MENLGTILSNLDSTKINTRIIKEILKYKITKQRPILFQLAKTNARLLKDILEKLSPKSKDRFMKIKFDENQTITEVITPSDNHFLLHQ